MRFLDEEICSLGTVSVIINIGENTPLVVIGTVGRPEERHHDQPESEEDAFISFTLGEAVNGFPVGSRFLINTDYIIAIGPVSTTA